ncbi:hypothetical protein ABZ260_34905 [Streptosporangium sp. NPDC006013]|uniref:hypothetical protein n=1 Tax=Streptosporangium sp. NPDC006013 TaxID=3155596 RepID=UPI0033BF1758
MRIVQVTGFGGPEVPMVDRAPEPISGAGRVVVGVSVVDVLFLEARLRTGAGGAAGAWTARFRGGRVG